MPAADRSTVVRDMYAAYESGDRRVLDEVLAEDFRFFSPADDGIDRTTYFERCWPNNEHTKSFDFKRLVEIGDEVFVTYEAERTDGSRFRNTEVIGFDGDQVRAVEVYFGWDL